MRSFHIGVNWGSILNLRGKAVNPLWCKLADYPEDSRAEKEEELSLGYLRHT